MRGSSPRMTGRGQWPLVLSVARMHSVSAFTPVFDGLCEMRGQSPRFRPAPSRLLDVLARDVEGERRRIRDVEALDAAGEIEPRDVIAGGARQLPQPLALGAQDKRARGAKRSTAEVAVAGAVEA